MGLEISDEDSQLGSVSHMYSVCGKVGLRGRTLALRAARLSSAAVTHQASAAWATWARVLRQKSRRGQGPPS